MPQTRRVTACPTRESCAWTAPSACGRITVSPVTRTIFTGMTRHGRLTEKTDLILEGLSARMMSAPYRYHYDSQHRLVHYTRTQYAEPLVESRYLYDPLGCRVAKRVWRRERDLTGWMSLSRKPPSDPRVRLGRRPADHDTERQEPASRRFISRGASPPPSELKLPP